MDSAFNHTFEALQFARLVRHKVRNQRKDMQLLHHLG